tara:strand:+ start:80 stop:439 length:360 start_codon:yes stop_codon:yes gene_type:complete
MEENDFTYIIYTLSNEETNKRIKYTVPDDENIDVTVDDESGMRTLNRDEAREYWIECVHNGFIMHSKDRSHSKEPVENWIEESYKFHSGIIKNENYIKEDLYRYYGELTDYEYESFDDC